MMNILATDIGGNPRQWIDPDRAVHYYASGEVAWDLGEQFVLYRGGFNARSGLRSEIKARPIIAIVGSEKSYGQFVKEALPIRENDLLFRRDHNLCAYCGQQFISHKLTRDHILPQSRGGNNKWTNIVTACKGCNVAKDNKTPEEAHMKLLYIPYRPCRWEHFILQNRNIISDQMEYLKAKLPKHSRYL